MTLDDLQARLISATWGKLHRRDKLFPGSPAMFRNRWDKILSALSIPPRFKLTPGSLRGGGAVAAYREGRAISDIQWSMRLQNQSTLAFYLQEVSAESVLPRLSSEARFSVQSAVAVLSFLLRFLPAH